MIKDNIKNAEIYYSLHPKFKEAFKKLINKDIDLKTKELYFNFDKYQTKSEGKFEAHRQYIDIQYIVKGEEKIGITNINKTDCLIPYSKEKDIEFLNAKEYDFITLKEGDFAIFYPHDAHMPCLTNKQEESIEKIVAKIAVR